MRYQDKRRENLIILPVCGKKGQGDKRKAMKKGTDEQLDEAGKLAKKLSCNSFLIYLFFCIACIVYLWFTQKRIDGVPVSGPLLCEKANLFHKKLNPGDQMSFKASSGWLWRFCNRHGM